jgi:hypothetical protein
LSRRHYENVRGRGNVYSEVLEEKLIPLLVGEARPDRVEINENSEALQIGNVMKQGWGGCMQGDPPGTHRQGEQRH